MRFIRWFDTTEVVQFAAVVAADYARLKKSTAVRMDDADKQVRKFEKLARRVEEFSRERRLNVYKKARMLSDLKDGLRTRGIGEDEVSAFVNSLLLRDLPG